MRAFSSTRFAGAGWKSPTASSGPTPRATGSHSVISGNKNHGVEIPGQTGSVFIGDNLIGTDATGTRALGNGSDGIVLSNGSSGNVVRQNVIPGNSQNGVTITGSGTTANLLQGNYIGTDSTGTMALANSGGVLISGAPNNTIGGTAAGAGNVVYLGGNGDVVQGNLSGTNAAGTAALGAAQQ
jgi:titin